MEKGINNPDKRIAASAWDGILRNVIERLDDDPMFTMDPPKMSKRLQRIIFLVDTSFSMRGDKINNVNKGLISAASECSLLIDNGTIYDTDISFDIMTFDENANWVCNDFPVSKFNLNPITLSVGERSTKTGKAFMKLDEFLDIGDYTKKHNGHILRYPLILLITDGKSRHYQDMLHELKNNECFKKCNKVAIGLKDENSEPSEVMLREFVDDPEFYYITDKITIHLSKMISNLSVSQSRYKGQGDNPVLSVLKEIRAVTGD